MNKYKRYERYKDSGIGWIGEIPEEWNIKKLKWLCSISTGNKDTINKVDDGEYPFFVRSPIVERISTYSYDGEAVLTAGDGVGVGKVFHYINGKFDYHQRVYKFSDFKNVSGKYFYYYIKENFIKETEVNNAKSTVDSIRLPMIKQFPVTIPSKEEQTKVVDFLDKKTTETDGLIADKEKLIELLQEKRQVIISEAVTKGINKDVRYKDSGIEWIGEIPEHWEVVRLKYLTKNPLQYGANESAEMDDPQLPRYIRITDIDEMGQLKEDTFKSLSRESAQPYLLNDGDILFARSGATVGKTYIYKRELGEACFAGYLIRFQPNKNRVNSYYIYYYTLSKGFENWIKQSTIQATIQNVSAEKYGNMHVPLPPIEEQKMIINNLNEKVKAVDVLIKNIYVQVQKLKEYRQSIISEAVTGKIDVRDYVAN